MQVFPLVFKMKSMSVALPVGGELERHAGASDGAGADEYRALPLRGLRRGALLPDSVRPRGHAGCR